MARREVAALALALLAVAGTWEADSSREWAIPNANASFLLLPAIEPDGTRPAAIRPA